MQDTRDIQQVVREGERERERERERSAVERVVLNRYMYLELMKPLKRG